MIQRIFMYMLIALIALQSVDAIADAAKFHQPNSEYAEADYFPNKIFKSNVDDSAQNPKQGNEQDHEQDADHCCSCHGVTASLLLRDELFLFALNLENEKISYHLFYHSLLITPDLRPPIV